MTVEIQALIIFLILGVTILSGLPIGISIGIATLVGWGLSGTNGTYVIQLVYDALNSFPLLAVPFFILAGEIMQKSSIANRLLSFAQTIVGHITGGFAHISILSSVFYGAISGSSPATVAAVGGMMIPAMVEKKYPREFSTAVNTAAGCIGVMIPPSVPLIVYAAVASGVSISDLFIAGILPGLVVALALMITSYIIAKKHHYPRSERAGLKEVWRRFWGALPALCVPIFVLGGIYGGFTTPTQAGIVAVLYGFIFYCAEKIWMNKFSFKELWEVVKKTTSTNASIFFVVAMATALGKLFLLMNLPDLVVDLLYSITSNRVLLILIIIVFLLIMGTFMDALANILILTPLLLPLALDLGINKVHFGIVMIVAASIGFLTPPVGLNLFVGCKIGKISVERLSIAILPFLLAITLALLAIVFIPQITLILIP